MKNKAIVIISAVIATLTFGLVWYRGKSEKEAELRSKEEQEKEKQIQEMNRKIQSLEAAAKKEKEAVAKAKLEAEKKAEEAKKKAAEIAKLEAEKNAINRSKLFKKGDNVKMLSARSLPLVYVDNFQAIHTQKDAKGLPMLRYFKAQDIIGKVDRITQRGNVVAVAKDGKLVMVSSTDVTKV